MKTLAAIDKLQKFQQSCYGFVSAKELMQKKKNQLSREDLLKKVYEMFTLGNRTIGEVFEELDKRHFTVTKSYTDA